MTLIAGRFVASAGTIFGAVIALCIVAAELRTASGSDPDSQSRQGLAQSTHEDPRLIVDARQSPYSAVGKFRGTMVCTAAIVLHPRIIITAGHCIAERDGTTKRFSFSFRPGYQAGTDLGHFKATVWALGSRQSFEKQSVHDASNDWAILVLDRAPAAVRPFLVAHLSFESLRSRERQLLMPSYSSDVANADALSVDPTCSIRKLAWDVLVHDCKALFGSSGAPLLLRDGPRFAIAGIHTGAMFASDDEGRTVSYIGNRAIASSMFAERLLALSRHLNNEATHDDEAPAY